MVCNGWRRWRKAGAAAVLVLLIGFVSVMGVGSAQAQSLLGPAGTVSMAQLPPQGRSVMALVYQGGPFRHEKDGVVFGNRERILPANSRGYYREYTVRTPGERSRGARRIVCGGLQPAAPEACYYSDDHYASFRKIVS